jgi:cytochrome c553
LDKLYPECSQHIQYRIDEASKRTREEEKLKSVQRMLAKGLSDADINELADLKEGELDQINYNLLKQEVC